MQIQLDDRSKTITRSVAIKRSEDYLRDLVLTCKRFLAGVRDRAAAHCSSCGAVYRPADVQAYFPDLLEQALLEIGEVCMKLLLRS